MMGLYPKPIVVDEEEADCDDVVIELMNKFWVDGDDVAVELMMMLLWLFIWVAMLLFQRRRREQKREECRKAANRYCWVFLTKTMNKKEEDMTRVVW
ncbi:transmembrane protein, putative [Medicago truncatula]|uniref:Transmembrane protein, putative n=1 Tax=Medicago truncatula TaxID=3880 RepID=G7LDX1_MEDTR|nr:transmembrane protein, putative [Medicago truncatula]